MKGADMANGLRAKLSKLRHDGHITDAEYKSFIKKDGWHDAEIRAKAIEEFAEQLKKKYEHCVVNDILMNNDVMSYTNSCSVFESFIDEIAEEMRGAV